MKPDELFCQPQIVKQIKFNKSEEIIKFIITDKVKQYKFKYALMNFASGKCSGTEEKSKLLNFERGYC